MSNDKHVEILQGGADAWNQWRVREPAVLPDLRSAELSLKSLIGANFDNTNLSGARLEGANLSKASFRSANLRGANMCGIHETKDCFSAFTLRGVDPAGLSLGAMKISWTNASHCDFTGADLTGADLSGADLKESNMSGAKLAGTILRWANLESVAGKDAGFEDADLYEAYLTGADFERADFRRANLEGAKLERTHFGYANLTKSRLCRATMVETVLTDSLLTGCAIHGISAWNIVGEPKAQDDLVVTYSASGEPVLTVDNLELAQFMYLILNNTKLRGVIDSLTSKVVLILGRFTPPEHKAMLEVIQQALRERGYVPMLFDFTPSSSRDLTETIQLLAGLAMFVVADLVDAKSISQELAHIVPHLPSVPIQPILVAAQEPYSMFEHWQRYQWVLPTFYYKDKDDLLIRFDENVLNPACDRRLATSDRAQLEDLTRRNEEQARVIEELKRQLAIKKN